MKLSTRVRYGVRAMVELAKHIGRKPIPLGILAKNQNISSKYLEQLIASLKIAGLVDSVRGAEGGYRLARPADKITVWDVYTVLDVSVDFVGCQNSAYLGKDDFCEPEEFCEVKETWAEMGKAIATLLKSRTIRELADREQQLEGSGANSKAAGS